MSWEFGPKAIFVITLSGKCDTAGVWSKGMVQMT